MNSEFCNVEFSLGCHNYPVDGWNAVMFITCYINTTRSIMT